MKLARNFCSVSILTRVYGFNSLLNATFDDSACKSHCVEFWWNFEGVDQKYEDLVVHGCTKRRMSFRKRLMIG